MHTRRTLSRYGGGVYDIYSCRPHCVENTSPVPFQPPPSRRRLHPPCVFHWRHRQSVYASYKLTGDCYAWMEGRGCRFGRRNVLRPRLAHSNRGDGPRQSVTELRSGAAPCRGGRSLYLRRDLQGGGGSVARSAWCTCVSGRPLRDTFRLLMVC